jgi:MFS family permease
VSLTVSSKSEKSASLVALDWLNYFLSVMRGGMGPYIVIYFGYKGFSASQIGIMIATLALTNALCHIPAGQLVDTCTRRRALMVLAMLLIALSIVSIMFFQSFQLIELIMVILGIASALIPPILGALSLGLVGHSYIANRLGRNDAFNHAGNVSIALIVGLSGLFLPVPHMLWLFVALCPMVAFFVLAIKHTDINNDWARGMQTKGPAESTQAVSWKILLTNRDLIIFLFAVLLFHLTNSALLPVVIQKIIKCCPNVAANTIPLWSTSCIMMAEVVMIFSAIFTGKLANQGRKNLFLASYAFVALRAFIFALAVQPFILVSSQFFDGMSAGIYGVIGLTILTDLTAGTGRFNLSQGIFNAFTAIGIAASNYLAGVLIDSVGFSSTCFISAAVTFITLLLAAKLIPETKDRPPVAVSSLQNA